MSAALRAINYFFHCEPIQVKKFDVPESSLKVSTKKPHSMRVPMIVVGDLDRERKGLVKKAWGGGTCAKNTRRGQSLKNTT